MIISNKNSGKEGSPNGRKMGKMETKKNKERNGKNDLKYDVFI